MVEKIAQSESSPQRPAHGLVGYLKVGLRRTYDALFDPEPPKPLTREIVKDFLDEYRKMRKCLSVDGDGRATLWGNGSGADYAAFRATVNESPLLRNLNENERTAVMWHLMGAAGLPNGG